MKIKLNNFSAERHGTTLIEVIAGLVILGTILSAMLVARGKFVRQEMQANRKLQAIHALDALVAQWTSGPSSAVPTLSSGSLPDSPSQTWRTYTLGSASASLLKAQVVRIEVIDSAERDPVVTLDLLVDAPPPPPPPSGATP